MYEEQNIQQVYEEEELEILKAEIKLFKNKYKGNYENTLAKKKIKPNRNKKMHPNGSIFYKELSNENLSI